jgi:hypothetical protein
MSSIGAASTRSSMPHRSVRYANPPVKLFDTSFGSVTA